jgi:WD40 repeat protein
MEKPLVHK